MRTSDNDSQVVLEPVQKLSKDQKRLAAILSREEAHFIVGAYYRLQENRIRAGQQSMQLEKRNRPTETIAWLQDQNELMEKEMKKALDAYSSAHVVGRWAREIMGLGPVISAALLAYIDIAKSKTAGHLLSYAGLSTHSKWEKGKIRPWNADLKAVLWLLGEGFVKVSNRPNDFYGKIYKMRKAVEIARNDAGVFAEDAARILTEKKWSDDTVSKNAYLSARLPDGHLHAKAKRYAVKMFVEHLWVVMTYEATQQVMKPYAAAHLDHVHLLYPPNMDMFPGLYEQLRPLYGSAATTDVQSWCDHKLAASLRNLADKSI